MSHRSIAGCVAGAFASLLAAFVASLPANAAGPDSLRIGIIGTGKIGGALAEHWAGAGHELLISSRHPERLKDLADRLGPRVRAGTPAEAAAFGKVVLISVPYGALPQVGRDNAQALAGKVVLETGNPFPARDGAIAELARAKGTGLASAEFLPGVRLVRAFTSVPHWAIRDDAHRSGEKIAIPLAGDDADALEISQRLVRDAGFEPVVVGGLPAARRFDVGSAVFGRALTARELRAALGLGTGSVKEKP